MGKSPSTMTPSKRKTRSQSLAEEEEPVVATANDDSKPNTDETNQDDTSDNKSDGSSSENPDSKSVNAEEEAVAEDKEKQDDGIQDDDDDDDDDDDEDDDRDPSHVPSDNDDEDDDEEVRAEQGQTVQVATSNNPSYAEDGTPILTMVPVAVVTTPNIASKKKAPGLGRPKDDRDGQAPYERRRHEGRRPEFGSNLPIQGSGIQGVARRRSARDNSDDEEEPLAEAAPHGPPQAAAVRRFGNHLLVDDDDSEPDPEDQYQGYQDHRYTIEERFVHPSRATSWLGMHFPERGDATRTQVIVASQNVHFACCEPKNKCAVNVLCANGNNMLIDVQQSDNARQGREAFNVFLAEEFNRLAGLHAELQRCDPVNRQAEEHWKVMKEFVPNNELLEFNKHMKRYLYYFALIRLGEKGFRLNGYEMDAAYRAVQLVMMATINQKFPKNNKSWPMFGVYLMNGSMVNAGVTPLFLPYEPDAHDSKPINKTNSPVVQRNEGDHVRYYRIESRKEVVEWLQKVVIEYEANQAQWFSKPWQRNDPITTTTPVKKGKKRARTLNLTKDELDAICTKRRTYDSAFLTPLW